MKNFEGFMRKFAKQNHVEVQWQQLRFGYKRAKISCHSWAEYTEVEAALRRNKSLQAILLSRNIFRLKPNRKSNWNWRSFNESHAANRI